MCSCHGQGQLCDANDDNLQGFQKIHDKTTPSNCVTVPQSVVCTSEITINTSSRPTLHSSLSISFMAGFDSALRTLPAFFTVKSCCTDFIFPFLDISTCSVGVCFDQFKPGPIVNDFPCETPVRPRKLHKVCRSSIPQHLKDDLATEYNLFFHYSISKPERYKQDCTNSTFPYDAGRCGSRHFLLSCPGTR